MKYQNTKGPEKIMNIKNNQQIYIPSDRDSLSADRPITDDLQDET